MVNERTLVEYRAPRELDEWGIRERQRQSFFKEKGEGEETEVGDEEEKEEEENSFSGFIIHRF